MKGRSMHIVFLVTGLMMLVLLNFYLFKQTNTYRTHNRELILQNDSLIAVNIELKRQITVPEEATVQTEKSSKRKNKKHVKENISPN